MHNIYTHFIFLLLGGKLAPAIMSEQAVQTPEVLDTASNADTRYDTNSVVNSSLIIDVRFSLITAKYSRE
jgi:hypothetical protein